MRCTQIVGLSAKARQFLANNQASDLTKCGCPTCQEPHVTVPRQRVYDTETGTRAGMFDDGPALLEYGLKDGRVAREVVQETVWSSGPCIFLCLEIEGVRAFEWSKEKLRSA